MQLILLENSHYIIQVIASWGIPQFVKPIFEFLSKHSKLLKNSEVHAGVKDANKIFYIQIETAAYDLITSTVLPYNLI